MKATPMERCPRFQACSAPLCPLDPIRHTRFYLRGEPVCAYLRELVKSGGTARVNAAVTADLSELIAAAAAELTAPGSPIYWPLLTAARQQSRMASGHALGKRRPADEIAEAANSDIRYNNRPHCGSEGV